MTTLESPITYYGGQKSLIPTILPMITEHKVYTEVFFGGGSVFFAKEPAKNETINDRLDLVINFYRVLKNNYRQLKILIDQSLVSRTMHKQALSMCRNDKEDKVWRAWAFWYVCNFSFACKIGGGMKYSNDSGTVPARLMKMKKAAFTELLVSRIEGAVIENDDAVRILKSRNVPYAFHHIDPPYIGADMGHYKGYTENEFIDLMDQLAICKGNFLLFNYDNELLSSAIEKNGWKKIYLRTHNAAPSNNKGRYKTHIIVYNYKLPGEQQNLFV